MPDSTTLSSAKADAHMAADALAKCWTLAVYAPQEPAPMLENLDLFAFALSRQIVAARKLGLRLSTDAVAAALQMAAPEGMQHVSEALEGVIRLDQFRPATAVPITNNEQPQGAA